MKRRQISATGKIDDNGRLKMYMDEINAFFREWKGANVVIRFEVASKGTSEALRGYYYNYVVPTFRKAIWSNGERMTESETERFLRTISPVAVVCTADTKKCAYTENLKEISEMSNAELIEHIETLKQIGAEEYNIYIEDPQVL